MALARVVTFDGVGKERLAEMEREMQEGGQPDDFPAAEIVVLHDADAERALVVLFFENEEDYRRADAVLDAMPADETPGRRHSAGTGGLPSSATLPAMPQVSEVTTS